VSFQSQTTKFVFKLVEQQFFVLSTTQFGIVEEDFIRAFDPFRILFP
jgi:hypothetical protein